MVEIFVVIIIGVFYVYPIGKIAEKAGYSFWAEEVKITKRLTVHSFSLNHDNDRL